MGFLLRGPTLTLIMLGREEPRRTHYFRLTRIKNRHQTTISRFGSGLYRASLTWSASKFREFHTRSSTIITSLYSRLTVNVMTHSTGFPRTCVFRHTWRCRCIFWRFTSRPMLQNMSGWHQWYRAPPFLLTSQTEQENQEDRSSMHWTVGFPFYVATCMHASIYI